MLRVAIQTQLERHWKAHLTTAYTVVSNYSKSSRTPSSWVTHVPPPQAICPHHLLPASSDPGPAKALCPVHGSYILLPKTSVWTRKRKKSQHFFLLNCLGRQIIHLRMTRISSRLLFRFNRQECLLFLRFSFRYCGRCRCTSAARPLNARPLGGTDPAD